LPLALLLYLVVGCTLLESALFGDAVVSLAAL
jgi:hypothetical protein